MLSRRNRIKGFLIALVMVLSMVTASSAADFFLRADTFINTMPDGVAVTMWGFSSCTDATFVTCSAPTVPGPALVVPVGDSVLNVTLKNNLTGLYTEPVSLMIPGQSTIMVPVKVNGRVRSFTTEVAVGATGVYSWTNMRPGTYLYQSATHPAIQMQMGLYGVAKKDFAAGQVYSGVTYDSEVVLVFSEIDPVIHNAIATNTYGPGKKVTSTIGYAPKYFLINGAPYSSTASAITAGAPGNTVLLRFLNAGLWDHTPVIDSLYMTLIAEDGNTLPYTRDQYSLHLSAGKTMDTTITKATAGYVPLYDRRLNLANNKTTGGGMLAYLNFSAGQSLLTVAKTGTGSGLIEAISMPGGINCGTDCTENYNTGTVITLKATTPLGSRLTSWAGVDAGYSLVPVALVTMDGPKTVTATFSGGLPGISVVAPTGAATKWQRGTTQTISWSYSGDPGPNVKIELLNVFGAVRTVIAASAPSGNGYQGLYNWSIPATLPVGSYKVRITSTTNNKYKGASPAAFKIIK